jgi:hypothetical protein
MKFNVYIKDTDAFDEAVYSSVKQSLEESGLTNRELDALQEIREEETRDALSRWVQDGEYVTLEFDTVTGTAVVVPRKGN